MAYLNLLNSAAIQASCYLLIGYPVFHWLLKFPVKNVRWGAFKLAAWRFGDTTYTVGWLPINAFFEFPEEFLEARTTKQRINGAIAQLMIHLVMLIACVLLGSISLAELGDGLRYSAWLMPMEAFVSLHGNLWIWTIGMLLFFAASPFMLAATIGQAAYKSSAEKPVQFVAVAYFAMILSFAMLVHLLIGLWGQ